MKKALLVIILLAFNIMHAQKADYKAVPNEMVDETNVFEVPGKDAAELYQSTKGWIA